MKTANGVSETKIPLCFAPANGRLVISQILMYSKDWQFDLFNLCKSILFCLLNM
jgi:hypothetical protein